MAIDPVFVSLLGEELDREVRGAKIEKIQQPAKDVIIFSLRRNRENIKLVVSGCPGRPRIGITLAGYENPQEPPMFCMLLRKHLLGAEITSVAQPTEDRILSLSVESADEFGRQARYLLYTELMNRTPNLVLVGENGIIIDCLHRLDYDRDMYRRLYPGMIYRLPMKNPSFSGHSPIVKREIEFRAQYGPAMPERENYAPYLLENRGEPFEFTYLPVYQYGSSITSTKFETYSALLDAYYFRKETDEILHRKSREIRTVITNAVRRTEKKLAGQREELARTEKRDEIRKNADLVTANIYRIRRGDNYLVCEDFFEDGCPQTEIILNPLKSAQENAALLYKEYRKMKTSRQYLIPMIAEGEEKLAYLKSVLDETERASCEAEINAIRDELMSAEIIRANKRSEKQKKPKTLSVLTERLDEEHELLIGRNNLQNDELTFKIAHKSDYWFHVKGVHGSHVILRCCGREPTAELIRRAAEAAAEHSQAKGTDSIAVDYTKVRNVKKIPGALPGRVTYTNQTTVIVRS